MASRANVTLGDKNRFRVLLIEGDVLPGELEVFAQAIAAAIRPTPPSPMSPRTVPAAIPASKPVFVAPNSFADDVPQTELEIEQESPPTKPQNGPVKKKLRTPKLVSDLEFTSGEKPLVDFMKEHDPKGHSKRYLAIVYWLKNYRNINEASADHIYTCYRALGLNVPKDVGSVLRGLKSQEWPEKGSDDGFYKITHIGENQLAMASE